MKSINKSLGYNAFFNAIKQMFAIIFPLITIPYASSVLGIDNYGRFNFSYSIVSYFALFAGLGVSSYAVREGARLRNNDIKVKEFEDSVFTINIISTVASYILLLIVLLLSKKIQGYGTTIIVLSLSILCTTVGTDWINTIYEDYTSLTVEYIVMHILSIVVLFTFVKTESDINRYAATVVIAGGGANIVNCFYVRRKYGVRKLKIDSGLKKHIWPIFILFFNSIAVTIYVNSDITMLGFFRNDTDVGIYSIASKIYLTLKQFLNAVIAVALPRVSSYIGSESNEKYSDLIDTFFHGILILVCPICVGLFLFSKNFIVIMSSDKYGAGSNTLKILAVALLLSVIASFLSSCIALPFKMDKSCLKASTISAVTNIALNFILIPKLSYVGAALTTAVAEAIVLFVLWKDCHKLTKIALLDYRNIRILLANIILLGVCFLIKKLSFSIVIELIVAVSVGAIAYFVSLFLLKDKIVYTYGRRIIWKFHR